MPQPEPQTLTTLPGDARPAVTRPVPAAPDRRGPAGGRPRRLHPWAWWGWALGVAVAASTTTHPWLLLGLGVAVVTVVLGCRDDSPWARAIWAYVVLALFVVVIRLVFVTLMGGAGGATTLVRLPRVPLPDWATGVNIGGPVTAERVLAGVQDALRLALVLVVVGAANALANPKRALRSVPSALYDVSVAVVIAITVAPQLVQSTLRVRRARRLRGGRTRGLGAVRAIAVPVLEDAVDRSLALAAAMEVRGYGRTRLDGPPRRRLTGVLMTGSLVLLCLGVYLLLSAQAPTAVAVALVLAGAVAALVGLTVSGRRLRVTRYRPDPWRLSESLTVASGVLAGLLVAAWSRADPLLLHPPATPLGWPPVHPGLVAVLLLVSVPMAVAPAPRRAPATPSGPASRAEAGR